MNATLEKAAPLIVKRPIVDLGEREDRVVGDLVAALASRSDVFTKAGRLVRVVYVDGRPEVMPIGADVVGVLVSEVADMYAPSKKGPRRSTLPPALARAVVGLGTYTGIRPLAGVVTAPLLRGDGSVLTTRGYDATTNLYLAPLAEPPEIPPNPNQEDARGAYARLVGALSETVFVDDEDRAAWAAMVLTPIARPAFSGPTPAFVVEANAASSGKTTAAQVAGLIATGEVLRARPWPHGDDELEKRLTTIVASGAPLALFDNVDRSIGAGALDAYLTSEGYQARRLGRSEDIKADTVATLFLTANNPTYHGDTPRRVVRVRLFSRETNPESKRYADADILATLRARRAALWADAVTILRAYILAGRPGKDDLEPFASYGGWSSLVRGALVWAGAKDPILTRKGIGDSDTNRQQRGGLVAFLVAAFGLDKPFTVADVVKATKAGTPPDGWSTDDVDALLSELDAFGPGDGKQLPQRLGRRLRKHLGTADAQGRRIEAGDLDPVKNCATYKVTAPSSS